MFNEKDYEEFEVIEPNIEEDIEELYKEMVREQLNSTVTVMTDEEKIHEQYLKVRDSTRG